jgi:hypothetical protein
MMCNVKTYAACVQQVAVTSSRHSTPPALTVAARACCFLQLDFTWDIAAVWMDTRVQEQVGEVEDYSSDPAVDIAVLDLCMAALIITGSQYKCSVSAQSVAAVAQDLLQFLVIDMGKSPSVKAQLAGAVLERERQLLWSGGLEAMEGHSVAMAMAVLCKEATTQEAQGPASGPAVPNA